MYLKYSFYSPTFGRAIRRFVMETILETNSFAAVDINRGLATEEKIQFLQEMFRIRRFEQAALKQYQTSGQIGGFLHLLRAGGGGRRRTCRCAARTTTSSPAIGRTATRSWRA